MIYNDVIVDVPPYVIDNDEPVDVSEFLKRSELIGGTDIEIAQSGNNRVVNYIGTGGGTGFDLTYTHVQNIPATVWYVAHNLNKNPNVTILNQNNVVVIAYIEYLTINTLAIEFNFAMTGKAICN